MSTLDSMSDEFDKTLLKVLKDGRDVVNKDGEVVSVEASAADLNVIRQRLKDCGVTAMPANNNPIGSIVAEMAKRKMTMPELDTDSDDAATA
jgi:hypothetical protein